ncbi:Uncharacterized conserved protein [Mycobacteroides abscessus subsp. bolletii]|uniref:DUF1349 domain-containing protein n=1 Tax=Mycobacteroides abscessus TaxID=36809 RepID=UPI00092A7EA0|nr:DUF1349 domain-containing protein [Mycobacteroides abscessus]SIJ07102.1 Uncharacterized conserved protein [Mycobacteroides abscessus subsp. bolletii]SLD79714.1 Uncharacterized conserved protein [Mycobacteroides abscessus subsp. bolletii]SLD86693.1 Uncharacterized conserved protein [Mycobacteroides abscessus subsp. bolletii]
MTTGNKYFGIEGWSWYNPPRNWSYGQARINVRTDADTDFWATTHYGFVRDSGHALLLRMPSEFQISATFSGRYHEQYDQAGLLIRLDAHNWIKSGVELIDGICQLSTVVTRDVSDWSMTASKTNISEHTEIGLTLIRAGDTVTISHTIGDTPASMSRLAYFPPTIPVQSGIMCASPNGQGFDVTFGNVAVML